MDRERSALIISEEKGAGNLIGAVLRNLGYQTKSCDSIEKAYKLYNNQSLIIFYSNSRKETIIQFLKKFNQENNHAKVSKYLKRHRWLLIPYGSLLANDRNRQ